MQGYKKCMLQQPFYSQIAYLGVTPALARVKYGKNVYTNR